MSKINQAGELCLELPKDALANVAELKITTAWLHRLLSYPRPDAPLWRERVNKLIKEIAEYSA